MKDDCVLVAHVTVNDQTLIVEAGNINEALVALQGVPQPGMRISACITFDTLSKSEFAALPKFSV